MKFLCIDCDTVMKFAERQLPGDGTMAAVFTCAGCGREVAMLTNPMETRLVSSLGVRIGGREVPEQPMELVRGQLEGGRDDAFDDAATDAAGSETVPGGSAAPAAGPSSAASADTPSPAAPASVGAVEWSDAARERLAGVPGFVRGMVKRIYAEWAVEQGVAVMTPETMDRARSELGMEGM